MGKIKKIRDFEKIAAGEVIERPVSVVKELLENSIDAQATIITIRLKNAGKSQIEVIDNGIGISEDDVEFAFMRHTTSKIEKSDDLDRLETLGFRGEALASIAAVSKLTIITRPKSQEYAIKMQLEGGKKKIMEKVGAPVGTQIQVNDLFYNLPVRRKFLKSNKTELGHITDLVGRYCLAYPNLHIKLIHNGLTLINSPPWKGPKAEKLPIEAYRYTIETIYGTDVAKKMFPINIFDNLTHLYGYIGTPEISRSKRSASSIFVNKRLVIHEGIMEIIQNAYKDYLMRNRYPFYVIFIEIPPDRVDFNLHPNKKVIKFIDEEKFLNELEILLKETISTHFKEHAIHYSPQKKIEARAANSAKMNMDKASTTSMIENTTNEFSPKIKNNNALANDISNNALIRTKNPLSKNRNTKNRRASLLSLPKSIQTHFRITDQKTGYGNIIKQKGVRSPDKTPTRTTDIDANGPLKSLLTNTHFISTTRLPPLKKLNSGIQAGSLYLIFQNDEELIIIDQHAAHERINYEKVQKLFKSKQLPVQELISPIKLEVPRTDIELLKESESKLKKFGFNVEYFADNIFLIRSIPSFFNEIKNSHQLIIDICKEIIERGKTASFDEIKDEIIKYMACHMSIVKGDEIFSETKIRKLIDELDRCENPFHCAHGRPTFLVISYKELDKWFHRT